MIWKIKKHSREFRLLTLSSLDRLRPKNRLRSPKYLIHWKTLPVNHICIYFPFIKLNAIPGQNARNICPFWYLLIFPKMFNIFTGCVPTFSVFFFIFIFFVLILSMQTCYFSNIFISNWTRGYSNNHNHNNKYFKFSLFINVALFPFREKCQKAKQTNINFWYGFKSRHVFSVIFMGEAFTRSSFEIP